MKGLAVVLALILLAVFIPDAARARAADATCPSSAPKLVETLKITLPDTAKPTAKRIAFAVDVGSDGRVRGLQLDESSGDPAVDLNVRQALQAAAYTPAQTGCVAYSSGTQIGYNLTADNAPQPSEPAKISSTCTPFVNVFLTPVARDRKRTGTAIVAVELDAAATLVGTPALRKSTGSPVLDQEALRLATTGHYRFLSGGPCMPQSFTDLLELTFQ